MGARGLESARTSGAPAVPRWAVVIAIAGLVFVAGPIAGLLTRVDWTGLPGLVVSPAALQALGLTVGTALAATALCVVLGVPTALVLSAWRSRLAGVVRAVGLLPIVMPPMVSGVALVSWLGENGLAGRALSLLGIALPYTTIAVVIAQTFVAWPFLVVAVEAGLRARPGDQEQIAAALGASPTRVFFTVTLPGIAPVLRGGMILCFARAVGEFGATALFAGDVPGRTQTMSLAIYAAYNAGGTGQALGIGLSVVLVGLAVVLLAAAGQIRGR